MWPQKAGKDTKSSLVDLGSDLQDRDVPNQGRSARFGLFHENKVGLGELFSGGEHVLIWLHLLIIPI